MTDKTRSRGYQMEMYTESLKRNIIITMDTGSGKTHIAVLRIRAQLEKEDGKLCWFLVPSIPLGNQQFKVLQSSLPPVNIQFLSGGDYVEKWKHQVIWDRVLRLKEKASTVVISTHQILLDALTHGFVNIDKIGLLIYDEAHHCVGKHPAHRIMKDFYHPNLHKLTVPAILGLTASPIVKSNPKQLQVIESGLNAISRTPILNREELMRHVHQPVLRSVIYPPQPLYTINVWNIPAFASLIRVYQGMDILEDPRVIQLLATDPPDEEKIARVIGEKSTRSHKQMRGIIGKANHILEEYGMWATEFYIEAVVQKTLEAANESAETAVLIGWEEDEKRYLSDTVKKIVLPDSLGSIEGRVTEKVENLITVLLKEFHGEEGGKEFAGLVFVQQRVGVAVLAEIIRTHPRTKDIFDVGTLVGEADNSAKAGRLIYELSNSKDQSQTIHSFRVGKKNLIISTSVVEEGLDIPACHLVVCFSLPPNVKSFIQRRGRARRAKSTYFLMFEEGSDTQGKIEKLRQLEQEMIAEYLDVTRKLKEITAQEEAEADEDGVISDSENRRFLVQSTGALLTLDSAIPHLNHFCGTLPHTEFVDLRPIFATEIISREDKDFNSQKPLYRATVTLPNSMPSNVRFAVSKKAWEKKTWAMRDAAFEAYLSLYRLADPLINNNLLPILPKREPIAPPKRAPMAIVDHTMDQPWGDFEWKDVTNVYVTPITLRMPNTSVVVIELLTAVKCPCVDTIPIYWSSLESGEVVVGESRCLGADPLLLAKARRMTYELFHTIFGTRMQQNATDFPYLFVWEGNNDKQDINEGTTISALEAYSAHGTDGDFGILRETAQAYPPFILRRWRTDISPSEDLSIIIRYGDRPINPDQPVIEAVRLSSRRDFLHKLANRITPKNTVLLLPEYCTFDKIPWRYSQLAMFLPGVIHRIELGLVTSNLQHTLLAPVGIEKTSTIITALSASSARESSDYQRLEFLGDSVLKFLTSVNLMDEHPAWHEGNLTTQKVKMVSNSRLARAAQEKRLGNWIFTEVFTGLKWSPRYINSKVQKDDEPITERRLSTKVLADVVEALIGASYVEGGYDKALKCIQAFGLEIVWKPLPTRIASLLSRAVHSPAVNIAYLWDLEKLIGYKFNHQNLLLEAITHPSCESTSPSYQRLEFLGDAVLDMVILDELFPNQKQLSPIEMHLLKSAAVNGNLLTFLSMGFSMTMEYPNVRPLGVDATEFEVVTREKKVNLWDFVHFSHPEMIKARRQCYERYESGLCDQIQQVLDTGTHYPWTELSPLEADGDGRNKFLSDIVEAIIGAVYVDSGGNFETTKSLVERLGVLRVLRRLVKDSVNLTHPVNRLAEMVARTHEGTVLHVLTLENEEYANTVWVSGEELATARSKCKAEAKAMASEACIKVLEERAAAGNRTSRKRNREGGSGSDVGDIHTSFEMDFD